MSASAVGARGPQGRAERRQRIEYHAIAHAGQGSATIRGVSGRMATENAKSIVTQCVCPTRRDLFPFAQRVLLANSPAQASAPYVPDSVGDASRGFPEELVLELTSPSEGFRTTRVPSGDCAEEHTREVAFAHNSSPKSHDSRRTANRWTCPQPLCELLRVCLRHPGKGRTCRPPLVRNLPHSQSLNTHGERQDGRIPH